MKEARSEGNQELENKIALFGKMPDECLTCEKPFDKKNKEMALSWSVVVHGDEEVVRLYCPECWDRANALVNEIKEEIDAEKS